MNKRAVLIICLLNLVFIGATMATSIIVSILMKDPVSVQLKFAACSLGILLPSWLAYHTLRRFPRSTGNTRDGFFAVTLSWIAAILAAAIPFFLIAGLQIPDAIFEAASGLTTTGGSVITSQTVLWNGAFLTGGLESLPAGLLYWRSLLNWLGGIGIVVFLLLILPLLNPGTKGYSLYNAEMPGLKTSSEQSTPRLSSSVRILLGVYIAMTVCAGVCYWLTGMPPFDAVCHALTTVSTGGFSTKTASIAAFPGTAVQWVCIVFMLLSSCNFMLTVRLFAQRKFTYFQDEEFRYFFGTVIVASILICFLLYTRCVNGIPDMKGNAIPHTVGDYFRTTLFQVTSMVSTTGFTTSDYMTWKVSPVLALLCLLMLHCGCGGSTSGGMKCVRFLLVLKAIGAELRQGIFPRAIPDIRLNGERIRANVISKTLVFVCIYLMIASVGATFLTFLCEIDPPAALSASFSCIGNIGPGLGRVSPSGSYAWMSSSAKLFLSLLMLVGRLEIYTCLTLLLPSFWKR